MKTLALKTRWTLAAALLVAADVRAAEFPLMKNGAPACCLVLEADAGIVERHAAGELAQFLAKLSGGPAPGIANAPVEGLYPVYLKTAGDSRIKDDGFRIHADAN